MRKRDAKNVATKFLLTRKYIIEDFILELFTTKIISYAEVFVPVPFTSCLRKASFHCLCPWRLRRAQIEFRGKSLVYYFELEVFGVPIAAWSLRLQLIICCFHPQICKQLEQSLQQEVGGTL